MMTNNSTLNQKSRAKSYVDTTAGIIHIYIPPSDSKQLHDQIVQESKLYGVLNSSNTNQLFKYLLSHDRNPYVHEWGHVLQTIHHPYLYLRSIREVLTINTLLGQIRDAEETELPLKLAFHEDYINSLIMNTNLFRLDLSEVPAIKLVQKRILTPGSRDISEIDLLEEDVSIFEFKVLKGEYSDGETYAQWLRSGPHYTIVFKLLSRLFDAKTAYHALPALVCAAYRTTYPVTAFASLLEFMLRWPEKFNSLSHSKQYYAVLIDALMVTEALSINSFVKPVKYKDQIAVDDSFEYVGPHSMDYYLEEETSHPLHPIALELWNLYRNKTLSADWFFEPFEYIKNDGNTVRNDFLNLQPPMMGVVYDSPDISPADYAYLLSPLYKGKFVHDYKKLGHDVEYAQYINHILTRKQIIWAISSNMQSRSPHVCIHKDCPYYATDLCKKFYNIPDRYKDCRFPKELNALTNRKLNTENKMLVKL